ncbi:MAG: cyclase [Acaryochloridaceae cyanobacterium SU_2_1]|nr:cyclase [Acaryochloridaceae cyanobacterium SU_2_1]
MESELNANPLSQAPSLDQNSYNVGPQTGDDVIFTTQKCPKRHRQIQAQMTLPFLSEQVWQVLIDYKALADFIPNLAKSERLDHPGIRVEQVGVKNALFLRFSARVVLDMVEEYPHRITFEMVEGDFKTFRGSWVLCPLDQGTALSYNLLICPTRMIPVQAIEQQLHHDLPRNLRAIHQRLQQLYGP